MKVAVAIITDETHRILIAKRPESVPHGGLWEFPGGKIECGESAESALIREIKEEVGLDVLAFDYLGELQFEYSKQEVKLFIYHVSRFLGQAVCLESQPDLRWVTVEHLSQYRFPKANEHIMALIHQLKLADG